VALRLAGASNQPDAAAHVDAAAALLRGARARSGASGLRPPLAQYVAGLLHAAGA
jgi:hypothetical protein